MLPGPILDIGDMGTFLKHIFFEKRAFCLLSPPKQMSFLIISNEFCFFKTQDTRLGVTVASYKDIE